MNLSWDSVGLDARLPVILRNDMKLKRMTPVQGATIPIFLKNKDVLVEAVTGSGKTLAFILPLIQYCLNQEDRKQNHIYSIVVSPTRELARQIFHVCRNICSHPSMTPSAIRCIMFVGGNNLNDDETRWMKEGGNIIISTPGRIGDLLSCCESIKRSVRNHLNFLVLDEADQLLNMGFERSLNDILSNLPKQRRTGLFSATQTKQLEQLIRAGMRDPVRIEIREKNATQTPDQMQISPNLNNYFFQCPSYGHKLIVLCRFLQQESPGKMIVFFSTCAQVDYFHEVIHFLLSQSRDVNNKQHPSMANTTPKVNKRLKRNKQEPEVTEGEGVKGPSHSPIRLLKLHRKLNNKRKKIFSLFRKLESSILLCTDVMSRGIDIDDVKWVIHFDLPNSLQDMIHRSGRSGHQLGKEGNSLLLTLPHEMQFVEYCKLKEIPLVPLTFPSSDGDDQETESVIQWMKNKCREERKFYELSIQSFVSFMRTYGTKNIMCSSLVTDLDAISCMQSFGLLHSPSMPELKAKGIRGDTYPMLDGDKEIIKQHKQVKEKLKEEFAGKSGEGDDTSRKEVRQNIRYKREKVRNTINKTKLTGRRKKDLIDDLEWKEMAEDAKFVKKLKNKKISHATFDQHFGL